MATIAQRNTIRDYYDLYFLSKNHMPLIDIIRQTKKLLPNLSPVTYTETLIFVDDIDETSISNHLAPAEIVTKQQIRDFFLQELKKIKEQL